MHVYVAVVVESISVNYDYITTLSIPWCLESILSTAGGLIKLEIGYAS